MAVLQMVVAFWVVLFAPALAHPGFQTTSSRWRALLVPTAFTGAESSPSTESSSTKSVIVSIVTTTATSTSSGFNNRSSLSEVLSSIISETWSQSSSSQPGIVSRPTPEPTYVTSASASYSSTSVGTYTITNSRPSSTSSSSSVIRPDPQLQKTDLPGSWTYVGCLLETNRTFLNSFLDFPDANSASLCLSQCSKYGFPAGGMKYGRQCACGDRSDADKVRAKTRPDEECNMVCPGNDTVFCGAKNRIAYYSWEGTPLSDFTYPEGAAAGSYRFLVGGVVIPLITMQSITGKVTFLEKTGTGAPNTTGAYELDLTKVHDFPNAWREMHTSSDIFCAAGLQLPDKAGRQIIIGGWAAPSTYGLRIYTPDGSAGNPGTNDWIETEDVQLQDGRWYPTAMVMANGSILVVGGESGGYAPPVFTLEILPKVGPPLYMDWLDRTDPLNLYPFMAVLPSGDILAAYYNEARILDERTFETKRVLKGMPGGINNPTNSGRSYPLEGSMMLKPQLWPYDEPLEVIICGGSTIYGQALDNCVSVHPDIPDEEWIIERMPSKRVMSCMTALPDGTFLILNGAQKGQAGFGLGEDPNLNAVLYDPFKPVHQRMSVMANTTVARMYHSEAITLADGRVLVTGSDPEEQPPVKNPQEYRVEEFLPPYLLSGQPRPSFEIQEKDWAYGGSYKLLVTSTSLDNIRVSLLGADSSTHGNAMGQRTLFPKVTCLGSACTVFAPPNSHICPPGWFKLFVLEGPTPSVAQFVRIGGDPGGLGKWPQHPKFAPLPDDMEKGAYFGV